MKSEYVSIIIDENSFPKLRCFKCQMENNFDIVVKYLNSNILC